MKRFVIPVLALALSSVAVHAADPGYADIGDLKATDGCQFVEVNLDAPLLKFASVFIDREDAEAAALVRNLKRIRVNVVGYNESSAAETRTRFENFRRELVAQGWQRMVTVQQPGEAEDVGVYVKLGAGESIEGVVVTVLNADRNEAVFVNVVGNIEASQLAALGQGLHLAPLSQLRISSTRKGA